MSLVQSHRLSSEGLPRRREGDKIPTNLTAVQSSYHAKKALNTTRHKLLVHFCLVSVFKSLVIVSFALEITDLPHLDAQRSKPCPNSPPMDRGVNNHKENRNRALINRQVAKRMTSTQVKPADSEIPGKAVYCREKEG